MNDASTTHVLGLPLENPKRTYLAVVLVLSVYALTMARDLTAYDSPELALVAHQLGLGHPIGQPLHTLLGFLCTHIPGVDPLVGLSLLSATMAALSLIPLQSLSDTLRPSTLKSTVPMTTGVLAVAALHWIPWDPATRIEVYSLANFFGLWAIARACSCRNGNDLRYSHTFIGVSLGLCASTNLVLGAAYGAACLPLLLKTNDLRSSIRSLLRSIGGGLVSLLPYAYLPWAGMQTDRFVWGRPDTQERLIAYLSGADYRHNQTIDLPTFGTHLLELARWSITHAGGLFLACGLLALLWRELRQPAMKWSALILTALTTSFVAFNVVFHPNVSDYKGYFAGPYLLSSVGFAVLSASLWNRGARFRIYAGAMFVFVMLVGALPLQRWSATPRTTPSVGRTLVQGLMNNAPEGAIVIAGSDHWVAPLLYAQEVEGQRPDLVIIPYGLSSSSWYWDLVFLRHPTLHPFARRGPEGREGRMRRFLHQNAERNVLVETTELAMPLQRPICGMGWMLYVGPCPETTPQPTEASQTLNDLSPTWGDELEVIARVGMARGTALWRLGQANAALEAYRAGLSQRFEWPALATMPAETPPLHGPAMGWQRHAPLHDPARNLWMSALLWHAARQPDRALEYALLAHADGLPEAHVAPAAP